MNLIYNYYSKQTLVAMATHCTLPLSVLLLTACLGGGGTTTTSSESGGGSASNGNGGGSTSSENVGAVSISAIADTTAQSLTVGTVMVSFSPLTASGGTTPYTYSVASGALPTGLSLNPNSGTVTGTPSATYTTASVVFSVQDTAGAMAKTTSTVSFTVGAASVSITASASTAAQSLSVGTAMTSFSPLTPSGGMTPYFYSVTSGVLPTGLIFNPNTGAVTGTPTATYTTANIVFSVQDATGAMSNTTSTVSFTVAAALPAGYVSQGGLTWMPVSATMYSYGAATALCAGTINGQTGWRVPTQPELSALYASGAMNGQGWTLYYTWSSTPFSIGNYIVHLNNGIVGSTPILSNYTYNATCVR